MNIYQRAKNLLLAPAKEWQSIDEEDVNSSHVLTYLLVLALIPAVAGFIGMGFIGLNVFGIHSGSIGWGFRHAISSYLGIVGGAYISAFVIDFLADKFQATSSFNVAFKVVAYSYTPMCVAGVFYLIPSLSFLVPLAGLYGLYILYTGMKPMLKVPEDKMMGYFIVCLLSIIVVSMVVGAIFGAIFINSVYF
ncbi:Yip1 family protein [Macellibacteroides fermentans]|uniref:Yip1 domain-containing protein n=1 Tax=Macellibacteroides fermentans TaxID=879969 RepID=A0A8E1ZZT0_9PORP|nr:Yip1 family protein [Macellibacteroides fermentans]NYI48910.1 hypothetical protein [Macellibacteroides fermentans]